MRYVYQEAQSVIIWLDTKGIDDAASAVLSAVHWMDAKAKNVSQSKSLPLQGFFTRDNPDIH